MKKNKVDIFGEIVENRKISKKTQASPNTVISKEFIIYYKNRYKDLFGVPAKIDYGKDLKLLNKLLKTYEDISLFNCGSKLEFLISVCEKYFMTKEQLALKNAWSLGIFYYNFSKLVLLLKNSDDAVISPIIQGYRYAYLNHTGDKFEGSLIGNEEIFSHIYLIIKSLWIKHGKDFILDRFAELYFLILFEYNKKKELNFFTSDFAQNKFKSWIENEGKESLMFYPKNVGNILKEKLDVEEKKIIREERFLYNRNFK